MTYKTNQLHHRTFENFVDISTNTNAKEAAIRFANDTAQAGKNILVIIGEIGCGKTLLALAMIDSIIKGKAKPNVYHSSTEKLWSEFRFAKKMEFFDEDFMNEQDIVLIDSYYQMQYETEESTLFNNSFMTTLERIKTKVVITCYEDHFTFPHQQINVKNISNPSEIKLLIQMYISQEKLNVDENVVEYLSTIKYQSPRWIEAILISVMAKSSLMNKPITLNFAKDVIEECRSTWFKTD